MGASFGRGQSSGDLKYRYKCGQTHNKCVCTVQTLPPHASTCEALKIKDKHFRVQTTTTRLADSMSTSPATNSATSTGPTSKSSLKVTPNPPLVVFPSDGKSRHPPCARSSRRARGRDEQAGCLRGCPWWLGKPRVCHKEREPRQGPRSREGEDNWKISS